MDVNIFIVCLLVQVIGTNGQGLQFDVFEGHIIPHVSNWGYGDNMHGPAGWSSMFPVECSSNYQSPIDIETAETVYDPELRRLQLQRDPRYWGARFELHNNGHSTQVNTIGKFYLRGGGLPHNYEIAQFHFHWGSDNEQGSEHTFDGRALPIELHIVAWNTDRYLSVKEAAKHYDGLAVLGVLYELSPYDNPELEAIVQALPFVRDPDLNRSVNLTAVDMQRFLPTQSHRYYRYKGSLTTPSCYESVTWTVFANTNTISQRQLNVFRQTLTSSHTSESQVFLSNGRVPLINNYRPQQPRYDRTVFRSFPNVPLPGYQLKRASIEWNRSSQKHNSKYGRVPLINMYMPQHPLYDRFQNIHRPGYHFNDRRVSLMKIFKPLQPLYGRKVFRNVQYIQPPGYQLNDAFMKWIPFSRKTVMKF